MAEPFQVDWWGVLPTLLVRDLREPEPLWEAEDGEEAPRYEKFAAARCISTYPNLPNGERDGDPIADQLLLQVYKNRVIVAVADGCNWGVRPREAAKRAVIAIKNYFATHPDIPDLHEAAHLLLRACAEADKKIMEGKQETWQAGTTTLIVGLLLEVEPKSKKDPAWAFVCCSVGDCKAFHYSYKDQTLTDITAGNRMNVTDTRDPGGRLGPYLDDGTPDLRNLKLYYMPCDYRDVIMVMSDGVHDNFDPQLLGKSPSDFNLEGDDWDNVQDVVQVENIKNTYRNKLIKKIILQSDFSPQGLTDRLIGHCHKTTQSCREFMEQNPNSKQPHDYKRFPGKMDHTTCTCFIVGHHLLDAEEQLSNGKVRERRNSRAKGKQKSRNHGNESDGSSMDC